MTKVFLFWVLDRKIRSSESVIAATAATPPKQAIFQTISKGHYSGIREPLEIVARNSVGWQALWQRHTSMELNPPAPPTIDFSKEIVVAVFLGERPSGYEVEITTVEQNGERLLVSFAERIPPPGSVLTQAFTQPFHIVKVVTSKPGTVTFRRLP